MDVIGCESKVLRLLPNDDRCSSEDIIRGYRGYVLRTVIQFYDFYDDVFGIVNQSQ